MTEREKDRGERNRWRLKKRWTEGMMKKESRREPRGRKDLSSFITDKSSYRSATWHTLVQECNVCCGTDRAHTLGGTLGKKHTECFVLQKPLQLCH